MLCAEMTSSRASRDMTVAPVTGSTPQFKSSFTQDALRHEPLAVVSRPLLQFARRRQGNMPRTKSFTLDMTPPGPAMVSAGNPSIHRGIRRPKGVHVSLTWPDRRASWTRNVLCVMFNGVKMRSLTKSMKRTLGNVVTTCAPTTYIYYPALLPSVDRPAVQQV